MDEEVVKYLEARYLLAEKIFKSNNKIQLDNETIEKLKIILDYAERNKGVFTVVLTSAVYKALHPEQDIRVHQVGLSEGYSGRSFDTKNITPFLKSKKLIHMAESGWLTRSLEQKRPYNKDYSGAITPKTLKDAFINSIEFIQSKPKEINGCVDFLLKGAIEIRDNKKEIINKIKTSKEDTIQDIIISLHKHFEWKYSSHGSSRLPVLAIFAIYRCLLPEIKRFEKKELKKLWSHTSPDSNSGAIGDIEVIDSKGKLFEAIEVKDGRRIDVDIIGDAYDKFKNTNVKRYYFLSTLRPKEEEIPKIIKRIKEIEKEHGCQVIVNGVFETIKYYLRLLENPNLFIKYYSEAMVTDDAIKREHLESWEKLISE